MYDKLLSCLKSTLPFDSTFSRDDDDGVNCWDGNVDEDWAVLSCTELFWAVLGCTN